MAKIDPKTFVLNLAKLMNQVPSRDRVLVEEPLNYLLGLVELTLADAPFLTKLRPLAAMEPTRIRRLTDETALAHYVSVGTKEQPGSEGYYVTDLATLQRACGLTLNSMRIYSYNHRDPRSGDVLLPFKLIADGQLRWTPSTAEILGADKEKRPHLSDYLAKLFAPRVGRKVRKY